MDAAEVWLLVALDEARTTTSGLPLGNLIACEALHFGWSATFIPVNKFSKTKLGCSFVPKILMCKCVCARMQQNCGLSLMYAFHNCVRQISYCILGEQMQHNTFFSYCGNIKLRVSASTVREVVSLYHFDLTSCKY